MEIQFTVPGRPKGKGRPRATMAAGHARVYTPADTVNYENWVRLCYRQEHPGVMLAGPVSMVVAAYFAVPKSYSKKKAAMCASGALKPTCKPDMDNIVKAVADALNGVAYRDDSCIVSLSVHKLYGDAERLEIVLLGEEAPR